MTPEQTQAMLDLLPTATSLREIARALGVPGHGLSRAARPFVTLMDLNGTRGICKCGKPRFHPFACSRTYAAQARAPEELERRQAIVDLMIDGASLGMISSMFGINKASVRRFRRYLPAEQQAEHKKRASRYNNVLPDETQRVLLDMLAAGSSHREIHVAIGLAYETICRWTQKLSPTQALAREAAMADRRRRPKKTAARCRDDSPEMRLAA